MSCDQFNIEAVNLYFIKSENLQVFVEFSPSISFHDFTIKSAPNVLVCT